MVRKRSRTSRKYYDDENDTDSDYALEESPSEPAPKKYSLRQRKRRLFTEFEFDDDGEEIEPTRAPSDDDDFEVERELALDEAASSEYVDKETYINHYEPENEEIPEDPDGLVDFEDMIRADIVVNKNRIDYDNIIQKTEIKVQPIVETEQPVIKAKRGRKPKVRPAGEIDSSLLEPETEMHETEFEDKNDKDYNPDDDIDNEEPIDCAELMHAELSESANEIHNVENSFPTNDINTEPTPTATDGSKEENAEKISQAEVTPDNIHTKILMEKVEEEDLSHVQSNVNPETTETNGKVSPLIMEKSNMAVNEELTTNTTDIVELDDDDVVLVEDEEKSEVIILDD